MILSWKNTSKHSVVLSYTSLCKSLSELSESLCQTRAGVQHNESFRKHGECEGKVEMTDGDGRWFRRMAAHEPRGEYTSKELWLTFCLEDCMHDCHDDCVDDCHDDCVDDCHDDCVDDCHRLMTAILYQTCVQQVRTGELFWDNDVHTHSTCTPEEEKNWGVFMQHVKNTMMELVGKRS